MISPAPSYHGYRFPRAVSIATSEYFRWAPRVPATSGSQAAMAAGDNQMVMSPRRTRARS